MQTQTTIIRKQDGTVNRRKTSKDALADAVEAQESQPQTTEVAGPSVTRCDPFKGNEMLEFSPGEGKRPFKLSEAKVMLILSLASGVVDLAGDLENRVEGGEA